jgi:uncharacterized damage-inducible protein DinB
MNKDDLLRLFAYDHWANRECVRAMQAGSLPEKTVGRIAHILAAEKVWLDRMRRVPQGIAVWPKLTLEQCLTLADEIAAGWKEFLVGLAGNGLAEVVEYKNSKGELWKSRVEDVLLHVVMHSAYHRGQIALEMRAAGMEPAYTDFIHAVRQELI